MVALIPALVIGVVILIAVGRISLPKSGEEKKKEEMREEKGALGNTLDFFAGEGTTKRGQDAIGVLLSDAGLAGYNFLTDPLNQRPDLTRAHYAYVREHLNIDTDTLTPFQVHDIVNPRPGQAPFPVRRLKGASA